MESYFEQLKMNSYQKNNKRVGVGALISNKRNEILLMFRTQSRFYKNCWFIPCGMAKEGESPSEAIIREVKKEIGLEIKVIKEIFNKTNRRGILEIAYLCKIVKGVPKIIETDKCKALEYYPLNALPKNTGRGALEIIEKYQNR